MAPVKVTDRLPADYEVALILLQMASGLSAEEFEKTYKLPEEAKKHLVKRPITRRSTAIKPEAKENPTKTTKSTSKSASDINIMEEDLPPKKRGRPSVTSKDIKVSPPAKKAKTMIVAVKNDVAVTSPAASNVGIVAIKTKKRFSGKEFMDSEGIEKDLTKWQDSKLKMTKFGIKSQMRERLAFDKLRKFLAQTPTESYQPQFIQKFVSKA